MSITSDIQKQRGLLTCSVCLILFEVNEEDEKSIQEAIETRNPGADSLAIILKNNGHKTSASSIKRHRANCKGTT